VPVKPLQRAGRDVSLQQPKVKVGNICRYVGDIFLMGTDDIIRPHLSVREGLEIVVSVGMALPPTLKIH
jgi:hypothetical protein